MAAEVRKFAYCPYSNFQVGAALSVENGKIYGGCNVENVSFTVGTCAERCAFVKATSEGEKKFVSIAVVAESENITTPCGACRQFINEFGNLNVYCTKPAFEKVLVTTAEELLPYAFNDFPLKFKTNSH